MGTQCPGGNVRKRNALGYELEHRVMEMYERACNALCYTKLCEWEHRAVADAREGNAVGYSSVSGNTVPRRRCTRGECAGL